MVEAPSIVAEEKGVEVDLELWRVPAVDGIYLLEGTTLTTLRSHSAIDNASLLDKGEQVRFPLEIPGKIPRLWGENLLILAGKEATTLRWEPLVPAGPQRFGSSQNPTEVGSWFYLGLRLTDLGAEPVDVAVNTTQIQPIGPSDREVRLLKGGLLPPGRYGLSALEGRRLWIFDVGPGP